MTQKYLFPIGCRGVVRGVRGGNGTSVGLQWVSDGTACVDNVSVRAASVRNVRCIHFWPGGFKCASR
jgi:hypothetical protein